MAEDARYTARKPDLVVQEFGDELVVYDRVLDVAHCLTRPAARVWRACQGEGATLDEITDALMAQGVGEPSSRQDTAAIVERALAELDEKGLLAGPGDGVSRRHALKIAAVGAGALAAPLVVSAAVPRPAEAFGSPATCLAAGSTCTTAPGQANSYGTSPMNLCCGPGVQGCPRAKGTGTGGCYCGANQVCNNCTRSGFAPIGGSICGDGDCLNKPNTPNRCCCSGVCASFFNVCA
jgi:PqqD family protein of HPr-rel-A system